MRLHFAAKNFASGQSINVSVYEDGILVLTTTGIEVATTGIYYIDYGFTKKKHYVIIAEGSGNWKSFKSYYTDK